jgi:hypothetical protein
METENNDFDAPHDALADLTSCLSELKELPRRQRHWAAIAGILRPVLEAASWKNLYRSESAFLADIAISVGYSRTFFQRIVRMDAFARRVAVEAKLPSKKIFDLPFGIIEEIASAKSHSRDLSNQLMANVLDHKLTLDQLRRIHWETVVSLTKQQPGKVTGKRLSFDLRRHAVQTLLINPSTFIKSPVHIAAVTGPLGHGMCDVIATQNERGSIETIAFKIENSNHAKNKGSLLTIIPRIALASSFHTVYWILSNASEQEIERFMKEIHTLALSNVGVASIRNENRTMSFNLLCNPSGLPIPDRRSSMIQTLDRTRFGLGLSAGPYYKHFYKYKT